MVVSDRDLLKLATTPSRQYWSYTRNTGVGVLLLY